ncbi:L-asparaginase [Pandoraea sputorum]|nr:L-asparaginase [Pandoraea sputorum]
MYGARDVTKASSFDLSAFEAPPFGPLGRVDANGAVHIARAPRQLRMLPVAERLTEEDLPRVDIVLSYAGADGALIRACVDAGCRGIVCAGLAPGRPAGGQTSALAEAARKGVVVVQSTRAARPLVPEQAFLRADGILAGGDLTPQKLRIFLMLALTQTSSLETLRQWLREL